MFRKVFISYAKEDIDFAEALYNELTYRGYLPWLDKKKLRPGAIWDFEIRNALRETDFVIFLLSSTSVKKRGYVQREFKLALEYSETKLDDDIYIIPVLLNDCEVPEKLMKYQWQNFNEEDAIQKILESLNFQRRKYLEEQPDEDVELYDFDYISLNFGLILGHKIDFNCVVPQFHRNSYFDEAFVNNIVRYTINDQISDSRKFILNVLHDRITEFPNIFIDINTTVSYISKNFLSITVVENNYMLGMHPNTFLHTVNIIFNPERIMYFEDVFKIKNIKEFLDYAIKKYSDSENLNPLLEAVESMDYNLPFIINDDSVEIYIGNNLSRYFLPDSFIRVPLKNLELHPDINL